MKKPNGKITVEIGAKNLAALRKYIASRGQTLTSGIRFLIEKAIYNE